MTNGIKDLFKTRTQRKSLPAPTPAEAVAIANKQNTDERHQGETYTNYGKRICGLVNASLPALTPFLQRIYVAEKNRQYQDKDLQDRMRQRTQDNIVNLETQIQQQTNNLDNVQQQIATSRREEEDCQNEVDELKTATASRDKAANAQMWIGLIILIPLTVYLFIFYSSTFYSAFFCDTEDLASVTTAMFNGNAIPTAWSNLVTGNGFEFLFIILAPVIFLGLGYALHSYIKREGCRSKVVAAVLVLVTFSFDCILAGMIGKQLYTVQVIWTSLGDSAPYTIGLALKDINTYAVIMCGFIAYIIWGIVFDLAYTGYEERNSNQRRIATLRAQINSERKRQQRLEQQATTIKNTVADLRGKVSQHNNTLSRQWVFYPEQIQNCLSEFFTGWISMMEALVRSQNEQQKANDTYMSTIKELFENTNE